MLWAIRITLGLGCVVHGYAQPVLTSASNAAGYQTTPKGNPPIAQGSIFIVFGSQLGGPDLVQAPSLPLGTALPASDGTSIAINTSGQTIAAYMVYALPSQVAAILPSTTPIGPATVTLTYHGQTSRPINIQVTKSVPGIFTVNAQGTGPAAAQVSLSATDLRLNNLTNPASPGSVVILYGTGLGPISGSDNTAPGAVSPSGSITATIGGLAATVLYAGRAPQFPGEDQINIQLPTGVPLGCYTPGVITVNGIPSNDFVLSTGPAGSKSCVHPMGLSPDAEATIDAGGTLNVGAFTGVLGTIGSTQQEGLGGLFANVNGSGLFAAYTELITKLHANSYPAPVGGCVLYDQLSGPSPATILPAAFSIPGRDLQAATALTLNGLITAGLTKPSMSVTQSVARSSTGGPGYLWINTILGPGNPSRFAQGNWSLVSNSAGPDVKAFSASEQLPQILVWTNITGLLTAPRNGVTLNWTGACTILAGLLCPLKPVTPEYVNIFGNSSVFNPSDPSQNRGKSFSCTVVADLGIFLVPTDITGAMPVPGPDETGTGSLGMSSHGSSPFLAFLSNGQRLDGGVFAFSLYMVNSGAGFAWK